MALFAIVENFLDTGGKVRIRASIDSDESVFFKYDHIPTQDEVDWEVIALLTARENGASN